MEWVIGLIEGNSKPALAFGGGTALYKLYLTPPARYSEDIDLIQVAPGPAGPVMDALRGVLDPWLGEARWKQSKGRVTFGYRFDSEDVPARRLRLKVEINTREHFAAFGFARRPFSVESRWFSGAADVTTFELDELLATKLRALYQRAKGRDLFDLAAGLADGRSNPRRIVDAFREYIGRDTSLAFGKRCREMGVVTSTGSAGDCFDNAMAESFFATLECELIQRRAFQTQAEAHMAVFQFIEGWYNTGRRHSALGYLSPNDFGRAASAAPVCPEDHRDPDGETEPDLFPIRKPDAHDHPPGLPSPSMTEKALLPLAVAHLSADADSLQLSTETG